MELIVAENKEIFIIEAGPEFGGEFLSDILIPERTGYNIIRESIKAVINNLQENKCILRVSWASMKKIALRH